MGKVKYTVLIVEDNAINRQLLGGILQTEYDTLTAENGAEALSVLEKSGEIAAVLLDIVMPVMDGYAFLDRLRATPFATVPVIAVTGDQDENAEQKALELGAWDFVTKPYQPKTLMTRLKNVIERSQFYLVNEMRDIYEHDPLTGLYNRNTFFTETQYLLNRHSELKFALIRIDIDRFHTYNAFWGEEEGNRLLLYLASSLRHTAEGCGPCTFGRIHADVFCLCGPFGRDAIERQAEQAEAALADYNPEYRIDPSFGVYFIDNPKDKVQVMYELATLAAAECKGKCLSHLSYYRPEMSRKVLEEQAIINEMQKALDSEQFEVYLQPKYDLKTERPYGAEALIRWRHPEKGMLSPGLFIPVFERNGFIGKVDYYMWERVCRLLRKWLDQGFQPGPVSVNVSRVNMYNPNLTGLLTDLVKKYGIPPSLLNLEVTESAYMENPEEMEQAVLSLQKAGFRVLMDDFGSGYSSLNTLKDIPVDVLKIDMKFLGGDSSGERSKCILASVIRMAGWLNTPVVMEGVETLSQVNFLRSIGCGYVQGFYYAKPMPVLQYEELISREEQLPVQTESENMKTISQVVWASAPQVDILFDSMEQPAGIYEFENGQIHTLRVNESFNHLFGYGAVIDSGAIHNKQHGLSPEDLEKLGDAFHAAAKTRLDTICQYTLDFGGTPKKIKVLLKYWGKSDAAAILFAQFTAV